MQRVVLDTNILVSALWSIDSKPYKIVEMVLNQELVLVYSIPIMAEYQDVLYRPKFRFSSGQIEMLLSNLAKEGLLIEPEKSTVELIDESDRIFLDTAQSSTAILITGNLKHFPAQKNIMSPGEFMEIIE